MLPVVAFIGIIAAGVAIGFVAFHVMKVTVKAIIGLVHQFRAKRAKKVLVAEINAMAAQCTNHKSLEELEKLKDQGVTHVAAGIDENGQLVDDVWTIQNEDDEVPYEVTETLGEEGTLVIEV